MTESINGLIWILERLHVTPSTPVLWILFALGLVGVVITPTSYIVKRWRLALEKRGNIVPIIGMIVSGIAFLIFLFWDLRTNGSHVKIEEATQQPTLPAGTGGEGGKAHVEYGEGDAKGGKGGKGGAPGGGAGGKGGDAVVIGGKGSSIAGDGGDAGQKPGDGGQGGASAWSKMVATDPLLQRVDLAQRLIDEYRMRFSATDPTSSGSEVWVNNQLRKLGQSWYLQNTSSGFSIIDKPKEDAHPTGPGPSKP